MPQRQEDQFQVSPGGLLPEVFTIQAQFVRQDGFGVGPSGVCRHCQNFLFVPVDKSGEIREAGACAQQLGPERILGPDILGHFRARANDAHLTEKDIPELRKFVDLVAAEKVAESGHS